MTPTERQWKQIIELDKQIDEIQADPLFSTRMTEYNDKVDQWIELAEKLGVDADGVKEYRGRPAVVRSQQLLF